MASSCDNVVCRRNRTRGKKRKEETLIASNSVAGGCDPFAWLVDDLLKQIFWLVQPSPTQCGRWCRVNKLWRNKVWSMQTVLHIEPPAFVSPAVVGNVVKKFATLPPEYLPQKCPSIRSLTLNPLPAAWTSLLRMMPAMFAREGGFQHLVHVSLSCYDSANDRILFSVLEALQSVKTTLRILQLFPSNTLTSPHDKLELCSLLRGLDKLEQLDLSDKTGFCFPRAFVHRVIQLVWRDLPRLHTVDVYGVIDSELEAVELCEQNPKLQKVFWGRWPMLHGYWWGNKWCYEARNTLVCSPDLLLRHGHKLVHRCSQFDPVRLTMH